MQTFPMLLTLVFFSVLTLISHNPGLFDACGLMYVESISRVVKMINGILACRNEQKRSLHFVAILKQIVLADLYKIYQSPLSIPAKIEKLAVLISLYEHLQQLRCRVISSSLHWIKFDIKQICLIVFVPIG